MYFLNKFKQVLEHPYLSGKFRLDIGHFEGINYLFLYSLFKIPPFMLILEYGSIYALM